MTAKEELRRILENLSEEQANDLLDYLNLRADRDTLSPEELQLANEGEAAIAKGDYVKLDQLIKELGVKG